MSDGMIRRLDVGAMALLKEGWWLVRDRYVFFLVTTLVGLLVGSMVPFQLLTGAAVCGVQLSYLQRVDGREPTWESLVKGLDYFVPSLVATLVTSVVLLVAMLPFLAVFGVGMYEVMTANLELRAPSFDPTLLVPLGLAAIGIAFLIQVNVLFFVMFAYMLIVDKGLGGVRALVVSTRAVWANLGGLVGVLMLLSAILLLPVLGPMALGWMVSWLLSAVAGLLGALLVSVVTLPVLFGVITVAYRRIFPAEVVV